MPNLKSIPSGASRHRSTAGAIVLYGLLLVAACSGKSRSAGAPPTSAATTSTSTTLPASTSATTAAAPVTPTPSTAKPSTSSIAAQPVACTTGQLTISLAEAAGGLSHAGYVILFKNTGHPCQIHGYPGVDGVNNNDMVVVSAQRTPTGMVGGLANGVTAAPTLELSSGQTASAIFEGIDGPVASLGPCAAYVSLVVTPPNETHSVHLASPVPAYPICYPQIHPIVAGTTGGDTSH